MFELGRVRWSRAHLCSVPSSYRWLNQRVLPWSFHSRFVVEPLIRSSPLYTIGTKLHMVNM